MEKTFGILYVLSLDLITFLRFKNILGANSEAQRELGQTYADILSLVVDITVSHQRSIIGMWGLTVKRYRLNSRIDDPSVLLAAAADDIFQPVAVAFSVRRQRLGQVVWDIQLQGKSCHSFSLTNVTKWLLP